MKRVGITGVTGLLGSSLARELRRRGDRVVGFSRSAGPLAMADEVRSMENPDLRGLDALVHLAGEPILGWWTPEKRVRIRASRVEGTAALVSGMAGMPAEERPGVLVCASAIGYYGDRGDEVLTEASAPGAGFLAEVTRQWEAEAVRAESLGVRVVRGRIGVVLAADGGAAPLWKQIFGLGLGGKLGSGRQWVSWVALEDLVAMLMEMVDADDLRGAVNLVSPSPVRNAELTRVIARILGRPAVLPAPAFALRLMLGGMEEMLLQSQRVVPSVFQGRQFAWESMVVEEALGKAFGKA